MSSNKYLYEYAQPNATKINNSGKIKLTAILFEYIKNANNRYENIIHTLEVIAATIDKELTIKKTEIKIVKQVKKL